MTTQPTRPGRPTTLKTTDQPHYSPTAHCTVADASYVSDVDGSRLKYRPKTPTDVRRMFIRENWGLLPIEELASRCGCTPRTVEYDIAKWRKSEEYKSYLLGKIQALLKDDEISKSEKLRAYVDLYKRIAIEEKVVEGGSVEVIVRHCLPAPEPKA